MKTKKSIFQSVLAITLFAILIIVGCKKKDDPAPAPTPPIVSPTDSASQVTRATDQTNVENESNQAMDDVNTSLGEVSTTRGVQQIYCAFTIDSTYKLQGKLILNYNGAFCAGKIRTGSITVQLPYNGTTITTWSTAGATASLTFTNYKVLYPNGNYVTLNGTHKVKNVNGGGYFELAILHIPIIHRVRSQMQISFNGGTAIAWNSAKLRTLTYTGTYPNGVATIKMAGDTVIAGYNNVAMWGTNAMGDNFTIDVPVDYTYDVVNQTTNCIYRPLTGEIKYYGIAFVITLTYGVDASGNSVPVGTGCPYGYQLHWFNNTTSATYTVVIPYP